MPGSHLSFQTSGGRWCLSRRTGQEPRWRRPARKPRTACASAPLRTPHTVAVMVMALTFHTKDPNRVGDAMNIFLFPDLSNLAGSEAALLTRKWDAILGGGTLNSFADTSLLWESKRSPPLQAGTSHRPNSRLGPYFSWCSWEMTGSTLRRKKCFSSWRRHPGTYLG